MEERPELYFPRDVEWHEWLLLNHDRYPKGIYLIFYKLETGIPTMRWEEAVKVALCFGWIDSTVKSLGGGKRRQYFCPRNPKSTWSKLNKSYIEILEMEGLIHESGWKMIELAKETGTWSAMDDVENGVIPEDLRKAFDASPQAFENYQNFAFGYRKSYLSWLYGAKREETRQKRISEIIRLCKANIKSRM
ncbi:YdeI/OmpD-associated family protein [Aureisphaera galaxeae]|uniref:YdeI/OmpD-associated family protein n=1 Tax=Aureisphaera galaxeae TaxID=1538023 RepID=UPI00235010B0|nr:YdeI/OmpD-associated family protein [Aureisphaera galaxeae]MDC8003590.1 YdeI/OmpD-associated family protein [Aureisphaera galaxeae]